jgi:hypothetical protein
MICTRQVLPDFTGNKTVCTRSPCLSSGIGRYKIESGAARIGPHRSFPAPWLFVETATKSDQCDLVFWGQKPVLVGHWRPATILP